MRPASNSAGGWIWVAGPVLSLPTAGDDTLGTEKSSVGPTAIVLRQENGWTYGGLVNHLWSLAGDDEREDVSAIFLLPFLSYTTKSHTTFGVNTESSYNWEAEEWTVRST